MPGVDLSRGLGTCVLDHAGHEDMPLVYGYHLVIGICGGRGCDNAGQVINYRVNADSSYA